jgi:hypothetical protein
LKAADAAGDVESATKLAQALRGSVSSQPRQKSLAESNPAEYDPSSKEFQQQYGPVSKSNFENFRAGWGKSVTDLGRGVAQLGNMAVNARLGLPQIDTHAAAIDDAKERDAPLMRTKAGIGGNITGAVATSLPTMFVPGANTYTGAAVIGAGLGAAQPVGKDDSRVQNASLGAAGGIAGKYIGGKVGDWYNRVRTGMSAEARAAEAAARATATAEGGAAAAENTMSGNLTARLTGGGSGFGSVGDDTSAALSRSQRALLERGRELGMQFTPGTATGSKALQQFEAKLSSQPMTSGPFFAKDAANKTALAREVAASFGESANTVDDVVLNRAVTRLGNVFESAKDDIARPIDPQKFLGVYSEIQEDLRGISTGFADNVLVNDLVKLAKTGTATGKQLQPLTSKLGKAAYKEMSQQSGDRELGQALYKVKDYVDDLLQSGMAEEKAQVFSQARGQYRNLMNVLSRTNIVNPSNGQVNGRALAQMLQQKDRAGFTLGRNRSGMYDAARISQAFPPIVGDSGTATRSMVTNPLEMMLGLPFNLASRAYASAPSVALATNVSSAANAAAPMSGELARALLGKGGRYAPYYLPGAGAALASQ